MPYGSVEDEVLYEMQQTNPILMWIAVALILFIALVLMFIYFPRLETIHKLNKKIKRIEKQRDRALNGWATELIAKNHLASENDRLQDDKAEKDKLIEELSSIVCENELANEEQLKTIKRQEGRIRQAESKAETFAILCDSFRKIGTVA